MREQRDVHVLENAGAYEPRLAAHEFLGDAVPDLDRALNVVALHEFLHRDRRGDVEWLAGVVSFAVPRRALDDRVVVADAGLVAGLWDVVDVGAERDHGFTRTPRRHERGGDAGDIALHLESVLLEDSREVFHGLEFLKARLAERENHVDHFLDLLRHAVDFRRGVGLELVELGCARVRVLDGVGGIATAAAAALREQGWRNERENDDDRENATQHWSFSVGVQVV